MSKIFLSYSRETEAQVRALAEDLEGLGHDVWLDRELSGGQAWWDQILAAIRDCELFLLALAPEAVSSVACKREWSYAAALGKSILPVLVADGVSTNLLPPALSKIQYVDHRVPDRASALQLARAIGALPAPEPLPAELPPPPELPISYLGGLTEKVDAPASMSFADQSSLLLDLKRSLRDSETAADARLLLQRFRARRDLLATIAEEIDQALGSLRSEQPEIPSPPPSSAKTASEAPSVQQVPTTSTPAGWFGHTPKPTPDARRRAAFAGGVAGSVLGVVAMLVDVEGEPEAWPFGLLTGVGGAIAGAVAGGRRGVTYAAVLGGLAAWAGTIVILQLSGGRDPLAVATVFFAPPGFVVGAVLGLVAERKARNRGDRNLA